MNNGNQHTKAFQAADIQRYVSGQMSPDEMFLLEKAALEDPFLADAVEGMRIAFEQQGSAAFERDMDYLRSKLNKGTVRKKTEVWWRVAALILILCTGISISLLIRENSSPASVRISRVEENPKRSLHDTTVNRPSEKEVSANSVDSPRSKNITRSETPPLIPSAQSKIKKAKPSAENATMNRNDRDAYPNEQLSNPESSAPMVAKEEENVDSLSNNKMLEGRAAGVIVNPQQNARQSAKRQADSIQDIAVMALGIISREKTDAIQNITSQRFEPAGGWDSFYLYLQSNLKTAVAEHDNNVQELSFELDKNGKAKNIRISRSISKKYDEQIIQLLTDGPAWVILKGKPRRLMLRIQY